MNATNWKPFVKNTLRRFCDLKLPSGMIVRGCTLHEKGERHWVGLPANQYAKTDGTTEWAAIVDFSDKETSRRFNDTAVAAALEVENGQ